MYITLDADILLQVWDIHWHHKLNMVVLLLPKLVVFVYIGIFSVEGKLNKHIIKPLD